MCADVYTDPGRRGNVYWGGDDYSYHLNKLVQHLDGSRIHYLRCCNYRLLHCPGTAQVREFNGEAVWINGEEPHTCEGDPFAHEARLLVNDILVACEENPYQNPRDLLNEIASRYPVEVASRLSLSRIRYAMRRARLSQYPNIPDSLYELGDLLADENYSHLTSTLDYNYSFYAGKVGTPDDCSIVFLSRRMAQFLESVRTVFVDGTFASVPVLPHAHQIYQIVTVVRHNVIPIGQVLMTHRTVESYRAVLRYIKQIAPRFRPSFVMMDFERAAQIAWEEEYEDCQVLSCYVHFIRASMKTAGTMGIKRLMRRHRRVKRTVRCLMAVPLLPQDLMHSGCRIVIRLAEREGLLETLLPFFSYFIRTWMNGWRYATLSVYNQQHRTNNACESANRLLRSQIAGPHHPSLWTFINGIRNFEHTSYAAVCAYRMGRNVGATRRTATIVNDAAIRNFTQDLMAGYISIKRFLLRTSMRVSRLVENQL